MIRVIRKYLNIKNLNIFTVKKKFDKQPNVHPLSTFRKGHSDFVCGWDGPQDFNLQGKCGMHGYACTILNHKHADI
jgi:hypothetical protein